MSDPIRISDMPIFTGRPANGRSRPIPLTPVDQSLRPEPTGAERYVRRDILERLKTPSSPPVQRRRSGFARAAHAIWMTWLVVLAAAAIVKGLDSLAPKTYSKPINPAPFSAQCGSYGPATSAVEYDSAGPYPLVHVVCANQGNPLPMEATAP